MQYLVSKIRSTFTQPESTQESRCCRVLAGFAAEPVSSLAASSTAAIQPLLSDKGLGPQHHCAGCWRGLQLRDRQAKWGGETPSKAFPSPGPRDTPSAWNIKCKLRWEEEGLRNWDLVKTEKGKLIWTEGGFTWFISHWPCENHPKSVPSVGRGTIVPKKKEKEKPYLNVVLSSRDQKAQTV